MPPLYFGAKGFFQPPRSESARQIVENLVAVLALYVRHVVAVDHPGQALVPTLARHALRRHDLEAVARRAEVEGVVPTGMGRILLRALLRWSLALALRRAIGR